MFVVVWGLNNFSCVVLMLVCFWNNYSDEVGCLNCFWFVCGETDGTDVLY
jgi:hypothetical protein